MIERTVCGIFPALITPFLENQALDEATLQDLIARLCPHVDGFVVNGTTGDFPLLTMAERRRVIEVAVQAAGPQKPVIAGTGAIATREAIQLTQAAVQAGAQAALLVAPYYLRPTQAGLQAHFEAVAEAVPEMPLLLYNFPQLVGRPIPLEVVSALSRSHESIIGIKDTSGDMRYMLALLESVDDDFNVLVGQGNLLLPALAMGARGGILAAANLIPAAYQALRQAVLSADLPVARDIQHIIYPVAHLVGKYGSLAVRAGLEMQGVPVGAPRPPLTSVGTLSAAERETLLQALDVEEALCVAR